MYILVKYCCRPKQHQTQINGLFAIEIQEAITGGFKYVNVQRVHGCGSHATPALD